MKKNKQHIVILSTWFPPIKGVSVARIAAFAKYLDKDKYDITVLSLKTINTIEDVKENGVTVFRFENKMLFQLPNFNKSTSKFIHYLKVIWKLILLKIYPDEYSGWKKEVLKFLPQLHQQHKIDLIISSSAPLAPHKVAYKFCNLNPTIKWITDLRDELSSAPNISFISLKKTRKIEQLINSRANALITVSKPILNDVKKLIPKVKYYAEIRNGYDHNNIFDTVHFNKQFTIGYIGTFYTPNKPDLFLECISKLNKDNVLPANWKIKFVGTSKNFIIPYSIKSNIEFSPKLTYLKAIQEARKCDVNLLILNYRDRLGVYSGKIFDYISVQKPIIALINKNDVAAQLITEINAGFIADFENIEEINSAIINAVNLWYNKKAINTSDESVQKLHRKYQVQKLEVLIEKVLHEK